MTLFPNITLTIKRYAVDFTDPLTSSGHYVNGKWVQGDAQSTPLTIKASVQPADGKEMQVYAEGRRVDAMYKCFTSSLVYLTDPVEKTNRDEVVWEGQTYEIIHVAPWKNGLISHYMFIMIREKESDSD